MVIGAGTAGLDVTKIVELAAILVAAGALAGLFAGVFGNRGDAVLAPSFDQSLHAARE